MAKQQKSLAELAAEMSVKPLEMGGETEQKPQTGQPEPTEDSAPAAQTPVTSSSNGAHAKTTTEEPAADTRVPNPSPASDDVTKASSSDEAPAARPRQPRRAAATAPPRRSANPPARRLAPAVGPGHRTPKGMERKDVPFWIEDLDRVESLAKALNRQRGQGIGERITYAMLVRVAVKGLLAFSNQIEGTTEFQLSQSFLRALEVDETLGADLLYDLGIAEHADTELEYDEIE